MEKQRDVVVFGEAMTMFIADEYLPLEEANHYTRAVAGAEVNVAVGLSRLGYRVGWISQLGDDPLGRYLRNQMQQIGVDTERVSFDQEHPTGFQIKSRVHTGDPEVVYFRKGSAASYLAAKPDDVAYIQSARHLHVTGIPPALSEHCRHYSYWAIEQARAAGMSVSFDPNLRPALWESEAEMRQVVNDLAAQADWVLPGLTEARLLTGYDNPQDMAQFYLDRGAKQVAIKLGVQGAVLMTPSSLHEIPAFRVKVVDTVGAGDGFAVGLISGMLDGLAPMDCLERAAAIAAMAVTSQGDQDGLPTREQLEQFLHTHHNASSVMQR
jgi:2-dehydro-3-deoxygluconokinase